MEVPFRSPFNKFEVERSKFNVVKQVKCAVIRFLSNPSSIENGHKTELKQLTQCAHVPLKPKCGPSSTRQNIRFIASKFGRPFELGGRRRRYGRHRQTIAHRTQWHPCVGTPAETEATTREYRFEEANPLGNETMSSTEHLFAFLEMESGFLSPEHRFSLLLRSINIAR